MKNLVFLSIFLLFRFSYTQNTWKEFTHDIYATSLEFNGNDLWVGTYTGGVYKWDITTNTYTKFTRVNNGLANNQITDIAIDNNGDVWASSYYGISRFNGTEWITYNETNSGLPANGFFLAIDVDPITNNIWIGSYLSGLYKFDGYNWENINSQNSGLSDNLVTSVKITESETLWIGHSGFTTQSFNGFNWLNHQPFGSVIQIKTSKLNNGVYFIKLNIKGDIYTEKFIKSNS
ncbi:two-component regulator propeller domain-containing protein [Winogradskyella sp. R77965]|uniref:two-component regulator propeller domain-containing protein n=1 Tax=Winogradskyella sp. R77965 TaxID=3093872 RepID=UPI0037DD8731